MKVQSRSLAVSAVCLALGLWACGDSGPSNSGSTGGQAAGGKASGGSAGPGTGGNATGASAGSSGGQGAYAGGGTVAGGGTLGGTGGTAGTNGSATGGSATGGSATGGSATGGSATGGSATGGSATGGSATGGSAGKGGATGGASGGTAGSSAGGSPAGGAAGSNASSVPAETTPTGYGKGTTGGGSAKSQDVATWQDMQAAIDAYSGTGGLSLRYMGKFDFKTITDPCTQHIKDAQTVEIKNKSNITILGADGSAGNFGIHIAAASTNIIVRNMTLGLTPGGSDSDIISIEGMSKDTDVPKNIWIDHNELFTSMVECAGAGDTEFDGLIDMKKGADNVTVSYNYLHDHHKVSLNGYSDSDTRIRHVTFHHNVFDNIGSRAPLQRGGYSHMCNNLFSNVSVSCVNVRMSGYSLVEGNYFDKVVNPVTSRDSSEIGWWELRNNNLASKADVSDGNSFGISWTAGDTGAVNATDWTTTKAFPATELTYTYKADPFACVKSGLKAVAGAGKGLATLKCN